MTDIINLLAETIDDIKSRGKTPEEIIFIGFKTTGASCTWDEFKILADREYDSGYGGEEVCLSLCIVFRDGCQMVRGEYDGREWWRWETPFKMPGEKSPLTLSQIFYDGVS